MVTAAQQLCNRQDEEKHSSNISIRPSPISGKRSQIGVFVHALIIKKSPKNLFVTKYHSIKIYKDKKPLYVYKKELKEVNY